MTLFRILIGGVMCAALSIPAFSQDQTAASPLKVRLHSDFRTYSDRTNVHVDASVTNTSQEPHQFRMFDVPYTTFQPAVYDATGREAETAVVYRMDGHSAQMMVRGTRPRTVTLAPHETFTVRLNLADYYELVPGRKYRVRLIFLPDASQEDALGSQNIYRFTIDETVYHAEDTQSEAEIDRFGTIRPGEVMQLFFSAEKSENWRDYLKYIDDEEYIFSFPEYAGRYLAAPPAQQRAVLRDFRIYLIRNRPDALMDFEVLDETVTGNSATVRVRAKRQAPRQPFIYVYAFSLEKYGDFWKITGVEASLTRDIQE